MDGNELVSGLVNPWDPSVRDRTRKQRQYLWNLLRKPLPDRRRAVAHFVGGRHSAKTATSLLALWESAHNINPGLQHFWSAPTLKELKKSFLPAWRKAVPGEGTIWRFNKSDHIIFYNNGEVETQIDLLGRDAYNSKKDGAGRGQTYAAGFFDELAVDPTDKSWKAMFAAVREPKANRLMIGVSTTPRLGWYHATVQRGVERGRATVVHATSYDNCHIPPSMVEDFLENVDPTYAEQEVYARWVAMGNKIWDHADLGKRWPDGNIHPHVYTPALPYLLGCDLGARSAWLLVQTVPGNPLDFGGIDVDVAVAQFIPNHGDTEKVVREIHALYGPPAHIYLGADANTGAYQTDGSTAIQEIRSLGWMCPITPIRGQQRYKDVQMRSAKVALCNAKMNRIFCVSEGIDKHTHMADETHGFRGIKEVLLQDMWLDKTTHTGGFLPKGSDDPLGLEHMRDAWMYMMIGVHPIRGFGGELERRVA